MLPLAIFASSEFAGLTFFTFLLLARPVTSLWSYPLP